MDGWKQISPSVVPNNIGNYTAPLINPQLGKIKLKKKLKIKLRKKYKNASKDENVFQNCNFDLICFIFCTCIF